ncbi:MAG: hypothetical protein RL037_1502, partial [Bacteroidota bacterium]
HIHDIGKWVFATSFLWSYMWFSQFMLIWYANIPEETTYYLTRIEHYQGLYFGKQKQLSQIAFQMGFF